MSVSLSRLLIVFLIFSCITAFGQSKKDLQKKKKELQKEISYTNKLLNETRKSKQLSMDELLQLKRKIESRNALVNTIRKEIELLTDEIANQKEVIVSLEKDLENLKKEYAKMIYYAYKNRSGYNRLMFIFSAEDFNQAYLRLKYLQQYGEFRKKQAELILQTKEALAGRIGQLEAKVDQKRFLIDEQKTEQEKLNIERQDQEKAVSKLQQQEDKLRADLRKKKQAARKLDDAIKRIIAEEIRKAREAAKKNGNSTKGFPLTPEALKLSNSFAANKGKLPWPVEQGVITGRFGKHPHPVLKEVIMNNNGIDISTTKNAVARSVFDGEVTSVVIIPGEGKAVFVRHGAYLSVYTYLTEVYVKKGDKVVTKQELGKLVSDGGKTSLHLEIWKGTTKLNPEYWIYRR